jgi:exonuclease VII small subunit
MVKMKLFSRKKRPNEDLLIKEINNTKLALEAAYSQFEYVIDPDLIDSCIFELNAIQNRYKYLLKQAKASEKSFVETKT